MRVISLKVYKFSELSEDAQLKALDDLRTINVDCEWWDFIYHELSELNISFDGFDFGRVSYCELRFLGFLDEAANKIMREHGPNTDTYKTAAEFLDNFKKANKDYERAGPYSKNHDYLLDSIENCKEDFKTQLSEDYLKILRLQYEYLISNEAIKETIEANDYEFFEDGKLF